MVQASRIFYFILFSILCEFGFAQNPYIRHLSTYDGLPSNTVYQIYQDHEKFIWLTTDAGVVRYDGSNFINYRKKDGLSSNDIVKIREDSYGRMWFSNINGSLDYYYKGKIYNDKNLNYLRIMKSKDFFIDFFEDIDRTLFFYSRYGEVIVLDSNSLVRKYNVGKLKEGSPVNWLNCLYMYIHYMNKVKTNDFIFWTSCGIFTLRDFSDSIKYIDSSIGVFGVFKESDSTLLVNSTNFGLQIYNKQFRALPIALPCDYQNIKTIIRDNYGYLWFSTSDKGVFCMKDDTVVLNLPISGATGLLQDHERNIWISTLRDGIYIVNHDVLFHTHIYDSRFGTNGITRISESILSKGLWMSSGNKILYYDHDSFYDFKDVLDVKTIDLLYQYSANTLFAGVKGNALIFYHGIELDHIRDRIHYKTKYRIPKSIKKLIKNDVNGEICGFDQNFIYFYDISNTEIKVSQKYIGERINNIFYTSHYGLLINATKNYLYYNGRHTSNGPFLKYDGSIITDMQIINPKTELFNIDGEQLVLFDGSTFKNLSEIIKPSIIYLTLRKILYKNSRLFLATSRNLYISQKFNKTSDLHNLRIWPISVEFEKVNDFTIFGNDIFIASSDGLTKIPINSVINRKEILPIILIKKILVNDKEYKLVESIKLVGKNRINFDIKVLCLSSNNIFYCYKLEKIDSKWTEGRGAVFSILFQNLPQGEYILKIKARKSNSDWSEPLVIPIIIKPTLYEYPLFWFLMTAAFIIVFLVLYMKIKNIRMKKAQASHQMIVLEQKALLSMMNPHFIFNSLGSIQNYLMKNKVGESILYLTQFSRLIRQNLNAVKLTMISLDEEIERLNNYLELEQIRLERIFDYYVEVDHVLEEDHYFIPSMMIQPFVENAIWHGISNLEYKGEVSLKVSRFNEKLVEVIIKDNGQGISKADRPKTNTENHLHIGMNMTRRRLSLLSKKYQVNAKMNISRATSNPDRPGTKITIYLPYVLETLLDPEDDNETQDSPETTQGE